MTVKKKNGPTNNKKKLEPNEQEKDLKKSINFPIVGIGASAGGLETLNALFSIMPSDSNIAFVIIQHLSPNHKSIMASLLKKQTHMVVREIEDGTELLANHVYLNPPGKNVAVFNRSLHLLEPVKTGAMAMVQQPDTAKYDGIPKSAVEAGLIDFIFSVEKMPDSLIRYVKHRCKCCFG